MKLYESYIKESKKGAIEDLVLVKNGFCHPAFFLNFIWFLYCRMFKFAGILFALNILISIISKNFINLDFHGALTISMVISFGIGLNANHWLSKYLRRNGYKLRGCVFAKNKEEAKLKFIKDFLANNKKSDKFYVDALINSKKEAKKQEFITKYFSKDFIRSHSAIKKY